MRVRSVVCCLVFSVAAPIFLIAAQQQPASTPPQATQLLQRALAAMAGNQPLTDVTITGSVRRIAGSEDESGTFVLKALPTGESRTELSLPSGQRGETRANSATGPVGAWSGPDGGLHPVSQHNLMTDSSWSFPAFALARLLTDPSYTISNIGLETRDGQSVEHLIASRQVQASGAPTGWVSSLPTLSRTDIYLDSVTFLPAAIVFNTHPDRDKTINIPVEIRLSNYQHTSGALIPLHVQQYLNNVLALDFQLTSFVPNSGISAATFNVQ